MVKIYILIEQAIGYGLLKVKNCKSTDELLTILQQKDIQKLIPSIELLEFQPFSSAANAALNCVDIANGIVSEDLSKLLNRYLSEINEKSILVVNDKKLIESLKSAAINPTELSFTADNNLIFSLREIRHHFHVILRDEERHLMQAHIGLGHGYSRIKIKYNVNRSDNMIIQTINLLDQIDKDINTMAMRLREWFGYHYPELSKIAPDYRAYARVVQLIKSRGGAIAENVNALEEILQDSAKAQLVLESAKTSMGYELTEEDFLNIGAFADKLVAMASQREFTALYLGRKMNQVAPNFAALVGDIVAARLISHAGSLINLAKFPASTIQILGAEKALFRAIKTRGNTPKYGLIFHSSFIGRAAKGDKGRVSRFLAAKISIAVRLDCFMEEPVNVYGLHLRKHVEDQLVYLESGKEPRKNYEMMEDAVKEAKAVVAALKANAAKNVEKEEKEADKVTVKVEKTKKRKTEEVEEVKEVEQPEKKKKKKNKNNSAVGEAEVKTEVKVEPIAEVKTEGKKVKKEKKEKVVEVEVKIESAPVAETEKKKKKKRAVEAEEAAATVAIVPEKKIKKEKVVKVETVQAEIVEKSPKKSKKSKKNK